MPWSWSPDPKELAGFINLTDGISSGIMVFDVEKKSCRHVAGTGADPLLLRDGKGIAFEDGNSLKIVDIASGRTREILNGDSRRELSTFALSADDKSLFVVWESTQADLWLMDLEGKH